MTMRPRILHVEGASKFGGDSVLILELGRAAAERGYEVDILATDPLFGSMVKDAGLGLVPLDVVRREIRPLWDMRGLAQLTAFLRRNDYSIVHTHTSKPGLIGRRAARWAGVPGIMHTVHLFPFHEETDPLPKAAYVAAERMAARWCDRIVTVSEYFRRWALDLRIGTEDQLVAIPNGVPEHRAVTSRPRDEIRRSLGLEDAFVLLSTGRLVEQKGLGYLLEAAPRIVREVPNVRILLAGDGPLRPSLEELARVSGVANHVDVLGFRDDIADLLSAADMVVMPSLWEGLSISLLEAMVAGKPVVTTSIGGNREAAADGKAAALVAPKDAEGLGAAICRLAHDPAERARLAAAGQAEHRARFTMDRMLDAYMAEYDRLETRSRRPAAPAVEPVRPRGHTA